MRRAIDHVVLRANLNYIEPAHQQPDILVDTRLMFIKKKVRKPTL